jgi:hypothetical protein
MRSMNSVQRQPYQNNNSSQPSRQPQQSNYQPPAPTTPPPAPVQPTPPAPPQQQPNDVPSRVYDEDDINMPAFLRKRDRR